MNFILGGKAEGLLILFGVIVLGLCAALILMRGRGLRVSKALAIFGYFFKIGCFTFGSGWSIVAQLQTDLVEKKKLLDAQELLDIVSVGRSLPGIMVCNVAYLYGHHQGGMLCGVMAVLGIAAPSLIILSVLTFFYEAARDNVWVAKALAGVRSVVAPIILSAALKLQKPEPSASKPVFFGLCLAGCVLSFAFRINTILIVLGAVAVGLLFHVTQRRPTL